MKLKGEDVSALDKSAIEYEVDQVLEAVDFDKNGFIEYSGNLERAAKIGAARIGDTESQGRVRTQVQQKEGQREAEIEEGEIDTNIDTETQRGKER